MPQIQFIQRTDRSPEYLQTGLSALARTNELNLGRAKELYDMSHSLPESLRVAVRNRAYELAGLDGYQQEFEKQRPKESDEEFYTRMSGAAQNPKGIAGAPGYDQALTNSVNEAVPEIRSVRKLAKPLPGGLTEEAYMAGLTQPEIDEDAIPDNQMNRIMTPEEYDRSTMNTDAGRAMADAYSRHPLAELEGDFVPPVAQSAAQPQVRSEAYKGDPMMRAGGEIDDPVKAQQILEFYVRKYDNPSDSRQNALAMASRLGLSQKNLYQIDSFFQGEHMKQHGVTRLDESMQRSYAPAKGGGGGSIGGGEAGFGYAYVSDEAGQKGKSTKFRVFGKDNPVNAMASAISAVEPGDDPKLLETAQMRISRSGIDPQNPMAGYSESELKSVERELGGLLQKYSVGRFGTTGVISSTGEINLNMLPEDKRRAAGQLIARMYRLKTQQMIATGKMMQDSQYDQKTHEDIEKKIATGSAKEAASGRTLARIPEFSVSVSNGKRTGSAPLDVLINWAPAQTEIASVSNTRDGRTTMAAGVGSRATAQTKQVQTQQSIKADDEI